MDIGEGYDPSPLTGTTSAKMLPKLLHYLLIDTLIPCINGSGSVNRMRSPPRVKGLDKLGVFSVEHARLLTACSYVFATCGPRVMRDKLTAGSSNIKVSTGLLEAEQSDFYRAAAAVLARRCCSL
jgi:hypothetical protein